MIKKVEPLIFETSEMEPARGVLVRLRREAMDQVGYIASRTGRSMCEVATEMIMYAARHVEIRDRKRYETVYDGEE